MLLSSFRKKMGRKKDLSISTHVPPSFPHLKTFSRGGSAAVGALRMAALLFSKICPASTSSSVSQTFRAQKTRSSENSVATDGNAARNFHTLAVWTTQQVAAFRLDPKLLHRTGVGLARPTTPPVSHLPKELQSEAAFFSEQCIITESISERGFSYFVKGYQHCWIGH